MRWFPKTFPGGQKVMAGTVLFYLLSTSLTGVLTWRPREVYIKSGEMVSLPCPKFKGASHPDEELTWTSPITQDTDLTSSTPSADQRQMGFFIHGRSLVILSTSANHQGNYSCYQGNASRRFWFMLTVYTTQTKEYEERTTYSTTCYTKESCTLHCPDVNIPDVSTPNMSSNGIIWYKKGETLPIDDYFPSVDDTDQGVYTCTRLYRHNQKEYNMTFRMVLDVQPSKIYKNSVILSPLKNHVFQVELGSTMIIECRAAIYSDFDEVFWLSGSSFVEDNSSFPVFYNYTRENNAEEVIMTASLVFKEVSEVDLLKSYTCKLETDSQPPSFVTITLAKKVPPLSLPLVLGIVGITMIVFMSALVYVKFKTGISLFLRDSCGCCSSTSDGKRYEAFLMRGRTK